MISGDLMEKRLNALSEFNKALEYELDLDFSVSEKHINSIEEFEKLLKKPFNEKSKMIFYRGERINDPSRPLVPTLLRNRELLMKDDELIVDIDSRFLREFYANKGQFLSVYEKVFSKVSQYRLYELCSFCQHYLNISPFIDFTKSLYVAVSFALKGRKEIDRDFVIYTAEISNSDYYTKDIVVAECWLNDYKVSVFNSADEIFNFKSIRFSPSAVKKAKQAFENRAKEIYPKAKLIDIPTNDLVKYQQGVFLMLTDFSLVHKSYLTKNLREDFLITKYVVDKSLCSELGKMISSEAPWYEYDCLLDIKTAMQKAVKAQRNFNI